MAKNSASSELHAGLLEGQYSPADNGELLGFVVGFEKRINLKSCEISSTDSASDKNSTQGIWKSTEGVLVHSDVQLSLFNAHYFGIMVRQRDPWPCDREKLFIDMDLREDNTPSGTRLAVGTAILKISDTSQAGFDSYRKRHGHGDCIFIKTKEGRRLQLGGIYASVVQNGVITIGDQVRKIN